MTPEAKLADVGYVLSPSRPETTYLRAKRSGNQLFVSGHSPKKEGGYAYLGKVGADVTVSQAQDAARQCVLNALSTVKGNLGSPDLVAGIAKVNGFVASAPDFTEQATVLDAASTLLVEIFGERGRHARTTVGVPVLPGNIPVEIEFVMDVFA